jgi:uncharacterized membrane protein YbaN (DUF454 family)
MKRWIVLTLGWIFVVLGILGLFLPILQGILFLIIGLLLLATEYEWPRRIMDKVSTKYPRTAGPLEKAKSYVDRLILKVDKLFGSKSGTQR